VSQCEFHTQKGIAAESSCFCHSVASRVGFPLILQYGVVITTTTTAGRMTRSATTDWNENAPDKKIARENQV